MSTISESRKLSLLTNSSLLSSSVGSRDVRSTMGVIPASEEGMLRWFEERRKRGRRAYEQWEQEFILEGLVRRD